jgi:hypothetical protein
MAIDWQLAVKRDTHFLLKRYRISITGSLTSFLPSQPATTMYILLPLPFTAGSCQDKTWERPHHARQKQIWIADSLSRQLSYDVGWLVQIVRMWSK